MKCLLPALVACVVSLSAFSQFSTGTWRDHLPYGRTVDVCVDHRDVVYCATPYSIFTYNPADGDTRRISKINLLSGVGISSMEYDPHTRTVLVGYENGNLDVLRESSSEILPDIRLSSILGDKRIYDIYPQGGLAYLSTGLGIVVVDISRLEVRSTYMPGADGLQMKVNDLDFIGDTIYAATDAGIRRADRNNPFLSNFQNWSDMPGLPPGPVTDIEVFRDHVYIQVEGDAEDAIWRRPLAGGAWTLFAAFDGLKYNRIWADASWMTLSGNGVYQAVHVEETININVVDHAGTYVSAGSAVMDRWGQLWVADQRAGLLFRKADGSQTIIRPEGPAVADTRRLSAFNDNIWVAHGGVNDGWGNFWNKFPMSGFVQETWRVIEPGNGTNGTGGVNDIMDVAVDPLSNTHVVFGSWEEGLLDLNGSSITSVCNAIAGDCPLEGSGVEWAPGWTGVAGVDFDLEGVLWCSNSYSDHPLHARDRSGNYYSFDFEPSLTSADRVGDVLASQMGYVWMIVPGRGLMVFSTNGTLGSQSDDNFKLLTDTEGNGGLPSNDVLSIAEDLDSELWVGTLQGLVVFYNQDAIFSEDAFDAEPIQITQDGNVQELLQTEAVTAIEVDGGNRKWVGTQNSGVFLFSADGLSQVYHFTEENSPLLSNNIFDIAINQANGEVFFATEKGIVSFFSTATNFDQAMGNVRAYPNPVRPEYEGNITVDGLAYNSNVKITDVQGNLVFETQSQGGRAVWDGRLLNGERPSSGIYYVYVANPDGTVDNVTKIAFVR